MLCADTALFVSHLILAVRNTRPTRACTTNRTPQLQAERLRSLQRLAAERGGAAGSSPTIPWRALVLPPRVPLPLRALEI